MTNGGGQHGVAEKPKNQDSKAVDTAKADAIADSKKVADSDHGQD